MRAALQVSIATLSWIIAAEICPLEIRAVGAGFHVMGDLMLQVGGTCMRSRCSRALELGVQAGWQAAGVQKGTAGAHALPGMNWPH